MNSSNSPRLLVQRLSDAELHTLKDLLIAADLARHSVGTEPHVFFKRKRSLHHGKLRKLLSFLAKQDKTGIAVDTFFGEMMRLVDDAR